MEDKIEVGEYVRTKRGIGKILEIKTVKPKMYGKHDVVYLIDKCPHMYISDIEFIKHSSNIIDLIEVGDYVNGHLIVNEIYGEDDNELYFEIEGGFNKAKYIGEKDIKSIVTKEQFESMEYKVEEAKIDE